MPTGIKETTRTFGLAHVSCVAVSDGSAVWDAFIMKAVFKLSTSLSFGMSTYYWSRITDFR